MDNQNTSSKPKEPETSQTVDAVPHKKRRPVVLVVVLLVVVLGLFVGSILSRPKQEQPVPRTETDNKQNPQLTVYQQADKINFEGDYEGAQALLDENIAKTSDPKEQGKLHETKSVFALNAKKYAESLKYAQKAEEVHATRNSAVLIARSAEELSDKQTAIKYYQKVLERTPAATIEEDRQYYRDKIKALGG